MQLCYDNVITIHCVFVIVTLHHTALIAFHNVNIVMLCKHMYTHTYAYINVYTYIHIHAYMSA